jgi:antitoxin (DNA-binding transcriptional repressor) of toxin-antitoxin stability system
MQAGPAAAGARVRAPAFDNVVRRDYIARMRTIGIRELKAKLSEELRAVGRGEVVLVTDRGRVVAELRAPGSAPVVGNTGLDRRVEQWLREGRARLDDAVTRASYPVSPLSLPPGTAARLLDEIRGEE